MARQQVKSHDPTLQKRVYPRWVTIIKVIGRVQRVSRSRHQRHWRQRLRWWWTCHSWWTHQESQTTRWRVSAARSHNAHYQRRNRLLCRRILFILSFIIVRTNYCQPKQTRRSTCCRNRFSSWRRCIRSWLRWWMKGMISRRGISWIILCLSCNKSRNS